MPKIGGRVWKTGVAIMLSLAMARILNVSEPVFVAIVALICVQPTVIRTFKYGSEQVQATIVGGIVALGMLLLVAQYPFPFVRAFATGGAAIFAMWLCMLFKWYDALVLAACTVVVIMIQSETDGSILSYSAQRTMATALGVSVAVAVNAMVFWQRAENLFPKRLPRIASQAFDEIEQAVTAFCSRDESAVSAGMDNWNKRKQAFEAAAAELIWSKEAGSARRFLLPRRSAFAPVLSEIHGIVDSVHFSAYRVLEGTAHMLKEYPEEILHEDDLFKDINEMLQDAVSLRTVITEFLHSGDVSQLKDHDLEWMTDLDGEFESLMQQTMAMRAKRTHLLGTVPIFEIAKVCVELRNYIRLLWNLRQLLIENERVFRMRSSRERRLQKSI